MQRARHKRPVIAIVTPVFNEAAGLAGYIAAVERIIVADPGIDARIVLVDDGSTDESWQRIEEIAAERPFVTGVRLSRNFGAHVALTAAIDAVGPEAEAAAVLAADLQDPPETVMEFVAAWRDGADIVWGARRKRVEQGWRKFASTTMESLLRRHAMPKGSKFRTGSFLLMDRKVIDCFRRYREASRVTFALVAWTGFDQVVVEYDRAARTSGRSGWSFGKMLTTAYDVFIGFSPLPAKLATMLGFTTFALSLLATAYMIAEWLVHDVQPGWTGLMVTITFFFGLLFMLVGMIAEYLYRIFIETKGRPLYFVSDQTDVKRGSAHD